MSIPKIAHITFEYGEAIVGGLGTFLNEIVCYQQSGRSVEPVVVIPFSCWEPEGMVLLRAYNDFQLYCSHYNGVKLYQITSPHFDPTIYLMNQIDFMKKFNLFGIFLGQCIADIACDIVHFHDFFGVQSLFSLHNNKISSLCTVHSLHHWNSYAITSEYLMINSVNIAVPVGHSFFEENKDIFLQDTARVRVIPNGIDLRHWMGSDYRASISFKEKLNIFCKDGSDNIIFGFIGRINERQKGFHQILTNFAQFQRNKKIVIVGAGDAELVQLIKKEAAINPNILFIDHLVDRDSLKYVYSCLDFIIIPSHFEPFGLILPEAMAQGVIPITSAVGGLKDNNIPYLESAETEGFGFLITDHCPDSLGEVIKNVSVLSLDCRSMLKQRALRAAQRHSQQVCFEKYEILYRELLHNREVLG